MNQSHEQIQRGTDLTKIPLENLLGHVFDRLGNSQEDELVYKAISAYLAGHFLGMRFETARVGEEWVKLAEDDEALF